MPVRTSQHAVLTPHALLPGAIAVLLACRATGWVGWTTPDAPAAASGLTRRAAIASAVARELAFCAAKKSFLQELCAVLLGELLELLPIDEVQSCVWPHISPLVTMPLAEWSAHGLLLGIRLSRKLPPATR